MRRKLRPLRSASRSSPNGLAMISSFSCNAPPAWKFCAAQSQERFDRSESGSSVMMTKGCRAFLIAGSGKPRRGHEKRCGSPKQGRGHEKHARAGGNEPGATRGRANAGPQKLRRGPAAPAARLTQKARKFSARNICPNLDSRSKTDLETQRIEKKAFRARANSAQSAPGRNRARDHPLQRRTRDHRATSPAAGPRRARGSAAAKGARPRKRASLARCKICDFGPELGFEQRNRFRSLRDTRRTEKKVLRKPPAGAPVVGQTFKYIY